MPTGRGIPCRGQQVELPRGRWDRVELALEGEVTEPATVWLHHEGGAVDPEFLPPGRSARVPVTRRCDLLALGLPDRAGCVVTGLVLVGPPDRPGVPQPVDLAPFVDNRGIVAAVGSGGRGFNIWDNAFPADELPPAGGTCTVGGVPFRFPLAGAADNVRCLGQLVPLPAGSRPSWLSVLGAAERRAEDVLRLHYADGGVRSQWLRLSDFWPDTPPRFGDTQAYRCSRLLYPRHEQLNMAPTIWQQRVPVTRPGEVIAVELPDNPAMHVFALTLLTEQEPTGAG